mmetsp:Transcript_118242/g.329781  ORF Transcript_118242/g.329781 Transcript_118242/m.329781 type:complete len:317 (-) Transcript_118242:129-1079(-)
MGRDANPHHSSNQLAYNLVARGHDPEPQGGPEGHDVAGGLPDSVPKCASGGAVLTADVPTNGLCTAVVGAATTANSATSTDHHDDSPTTTVSCTTTSAVSACHPASDIGSGSTASSCSPDPSTTAECSGCRPSCRPSRGGAEHLPGVAGRRCAVGAGVAAAAGVQLGRGGRHHPPAVRRAGACDHDHDDRHAATDANYSRLRAAAANGSTTANGTCANRGDYTEGIVCAVDASNASSCAGSNPSASVAVCSAAAAGSTTRNAGGRLEGPVGFGSVVWKPAGGGCAASAGTAGWHVTRALPLPDGIGAVQVGHSSHS